MSAAMEAAIEGVPSVGFSSLDYSFDQDFALSKNVAFTITKKMLRTELPVGTLFNVNIPVATEEEFKGIRISRQADAKWVEAFDERRDPRGKKYYWLTGEFVNRDKGEDTDVWALANNYASLVPVQFDLTDYKLKKQIEAEWKF
jgi:5'-nucleotidase